MPELFTSPWPRGFLFSRVLGWAWALTLAQRGTLGEMAVTLTGSDTRQDKESLSSAT